MIQVSLELLFHFNCDKCRRWWSIADFQSWECGTIICPHCGAVHDLPKMPTVPNASEFLNMARVEESPT